MGVIRLTENDIHRLVANTIKMLLESADEKSGVIMSEKEDEIQEIIDFISKWWESSRGDRSKIIKSGSIGIAGESNAGTIDVYCFDVPNEITKKLDVALNHEIEVSIMDYHFDADRYGKYMGKSERATNGTSYAGEEYTDFVKPEMKFYKSKIDLTIPSMNGELQLQGLYVTLYHELNHNVSSLRINQKGFEGKNISNMNRRGNTYRHINMMQALNPHPIAQFYREMNYDREEQEMLRMMVFMIYGLWETTERNARAESLYGDLLYMKTTPESFEKDFKNTDVYHEMELFKDFISKGEVFDENSGVWREVAQLIGYKNVNSLNTASVKRRFLKRSRELVDVLYKKAMKVAKYYFQKKGFSQTNAPGM